MLIGGRRRPIVGVVTMDQLMVDCGDEPVRVGDEVVLLGAQGGERIRPEEWAARLGTIALRDRLRDLEPHPAGARTSSRIEQPCSRSLHRRSW